MWIAFKLLSYIGVSQAFIRCSITYPCCELLSNCYLTSVFHKCLDYFWRIRIVVNCFQIVILHRCFTSQIAASYYTVVLWIAFKLLSYIGVSQAFNSYTWAPDCCELLSNCYLTSVFHKHLITEQGQRTVVNCFQIVILHRCFTSR